MAKVVTKTGDSGTTSLKGQRVQKTHPYIKLLGHLDHLSSMIGAYDDRPDLQNLIYRMSGAVAGYDVPLNDLPAIEQEIESYDLSKIQSKFVRNKGLKHLIRTEIRKTEIAAWEAESEQVAQILNRLSDLYFILAEV